MYDANLTVDLLDDFYSDASAKEYSVTKNGHQVIEMKSIQLNSMKKRFEHQKKKFLMN